VTALAKKRSDNLEHRAAARFVLAMGFIAYEGAKIVLNLSTGKVQPAAAVTTAPTLAMGVAFGKVDATAADAPLEVVFDRGFHGRWWANSGTVPVVATDVGHLAYFEDDQTVRATAAAGLAIGGRIWAVSATEGVFVEELSTLAPGGGPAVIGALPAFAAANLLVPAGSAHGSLFDVPTTAANSTVTLPAAAREGTRLYFVADGTKNGHTVTYRDETGPTALTTALTASKRHQVTAIFLNGKWTANAYVSP
jgi:hypothetical protein